MHNGSILCSIRMNECFSFVLNTDKGCPISNTLLVTKCLILQTLNILLVWIFSGTT